MNISIDAVEKRYGGVTALNGPSFEIPSGSTYGILGTNGAGKTTLFRLLVGHDRPDAGTITVGGIDTVTAGDAVRTKVGYLPEQVGFPGLLTGEEVLSVHASVHDLASAPERIASVLATVGLEDAAHRRVEGYSNGMRRRLGLGAALLAKPPVLVLDEPTAGLDPRGVESFHRIIEAIDRETDATVVLSSHALTEVERVCDRIAILHEGRLCASGRVDELTVATGEEVTVTLRPTTSDARDRLRTLLADFRIGSKNHDGSIELTCHRSQAIDLVGQVHPLDIDHIEVREPGLDAAFNAAIDADVEVSAA